ncbi:hypothetical protein [Roseiflexus sp.]|uniref:hypothetical protein n=1 Tax=Roseiflexus sp. TaxID=2562120 RepID=UPI0021DCEE7E|nr:hypothetical protein [Roseiflexus sp.]GIV99967.1 MAG: hypothetical protein KatS3mg058_1371 [Roseiflexus sp.]
MKTYTAPAMDVPRSCSESRHGAVAWRQWGLAGVLAILAFGIGLVFAPGGLRFDAADSAAERHLVRFSAAEANEREAYRWSERGAALRLFGLTRRPLIVDLRMTSPRPAGAAPAEIRFALGSWHSNAFIIEGDWRRYQALLPPRPGAPDLRLEIRTFRPAKESDKRDLGAALNRVAIFPADGLTPPIGSIATLGKVRAIILLLLPIALFAATSRTEPRTAPWIAVVGAAVLLAVAVAHPVDAVALLPDLWLIPVGTAVSAAIFFGAQPHLTPMLVFLRHALASDAARLAAVLVVAAIQGMVFLALVPPWQHYDEPAHFEFAWLLAFHPSWPAVGTVNPAIAWIGGEGRALSHLPTYHLLVSLPLRLAGGWSVIDQLYLARVVSLALFIATIAILGGIARTLFSVGHPMRWLLPLVAALIPPFADIMTAVNNDVGAIMAFSLFLWSVVHILVLGWSARRAAWTIGAALLAAAMKNVTLIAVPLAAVVLFIAWGIRQRWRWRRLVGLLAALVTGVLAFSLAWSDPAAWYRYGGVSGDGAARVALSDAPHGRHAFRLAAGFSPYEVSGLSAPLALADLPVIAGGPVTIGAWVWASRATTAAGPIILYNDLTPELRTITMASVDVDVQPRFVVWTFDAPPVMRTMQVLMPAPTPMNGEPPVTFFFDGLVVVQGKYPAHTPPQLNDTAIAGHWNGQTVTNLVRNGSAEHGWLYLRPTIDSRAWPLVRRSPSRVLTSLLDFERTGPIVLFNVVPDLTFRSLMTFGWGEVEPEDRVWRNVLPIMMLALLLGFARAVVANAGNASPRRVAVAVFAFVGFLLWTNAALRILPALVAQPPPFPRYGFPAIAPLALVIAVGWLAWWPVHRRATGAAALVIAMLMVNALAYATMWWRWYV